MKKVLRLIVILYIFCTHSVLGQVAWLPMDEQLKLPPIATYSFEKGFFALQATSDIGFRQSTVELSKWNGQFWATYPSILLEQFVFSPDNKFAITFHQNKPYIAGSFKSDDKSKTGIVRWNGVAWETVGGGIESDFVVHNEISISDMVSYNNNLFVCGQFNIAGGNPVHNFVVLQSGVWKTIETNRGTINDLQLMKDTLFAAGLFNQIEGKATTNIAANYKGVWVPVNSPSSAEIKGLALYDTSLVAIAGNQVFLRTLSGWQFLSNQWNYEIVRLGNAVEFEGKLYLAGTFKNSKGITSHLIVWDGLQWQSVISQSDILPATETMYSITSRENELIFSGKITSFLGKEVFNSIRLFPGKTIVSGNVFIDNVKNCKYELGDEPVENAILNVNDSYYTSTDSLGNYNFVLDENKKYILKIFPGELYTSLCRSETIEINTTNKDSFIQLNFPLNTSPSPHLPKFEISSASGFKARHGYTAAYTIKHNSPSELYPLTITLDFDKRLSFVNSDIAPSYMDSSTVRWVLNKDEKIRLNFLVNHEKVNVGDNLKFILSGAFVSGDAETNVLNQTVTSAYDPNEKQCNTYEIEEGESQLNYHIQFQNLGNDSAVNIHIVDTIDPRLPIQYIKMKGYAEAHQNKVSFKVRNHAIIWSFKEIYLPSKSIAGDEPSSGFITYNTFMAPGLKAGNVISNQASIYFDFQDAVITNKVETKIIKRTTPVPGGKNGTLLIFPNPAVTEKITVQFSPYLIKKVEVFDMAGQKLFTKDIQAAPSTQIDLPHLSQGIYIINVTHTVGSVSQKFFIKR